MNNGKISQKTRILTALLVGDELTPLDILNRFGSLRASARIMEIREMGYRIDNVNRERGVNYAVYKYIKPEPVQRELF